jgi:hypothetical protein
LNLFGAAIDPEGDLFGLLHLLDTFATVDGFLAAGLTDRIQIAGENGIRELVDAAPMPEDPWLDVIDGAGGNLRLLKREIRPVCILEEDAAGRVDPMGKGSASVHVAHERFQIELIELNAFLIGAYLFAHFGLSDEEVGSLSSKISAGEGRNLFGFGDGEIVLEHLRKKGWNLSGRDKDAARFVTTAIRRLRTTA